MDISITLDSVKKIMTKDTTISHAPKILSIDDDETIRAIIHTVLTSLSGYEVVCASSGQQALSILNNYTPDLILLDSVIPGMDGLEILTHLKSDPETRNIPVVILTATTTAERMLEFTASGAAGIIHKPFDPMLLPFEVGRYLNVI